MDDRGDCRFGDSRLCEYIESCYAYSGCEHRHHVISESERELDGVRVVVSALAVRSARRLARRYGYGYPMIGHEADDLFQDSILRLLRGDPPRDLDIPLDKYLADRIDTRRRGIERRTENDPQKTKIIHNFSEEKFSFNPDSPDNISSIDLYRTNRIETQKMLELNQLYESIVKEDTKLKPLMDLICDKGDIPAEDLAKILKCEKKDIYAQKKRISILYKRMKKHAEVKS